MSYTIFRLTDGTTTQSLLGSGVFLQESGGSPRLPQLGEETLGQVGPYQDAEVEFKLNITSVGPITTNQIIRTLQTWQYQARRWNDGVPGIVAVRLEAQVTGSSLLLDAVVLDLDLTLPDDYHDLFVIGEVNGALLRLRLRVFLAPLETAVNSSATNVGDIFTLTFASSHPLLSPLRLTWTAPVSARVPATGPLIITGASGDLAVFDAETLGASGAYSLNTPASTLVARGGQVLRFTTPAVSLREARFFTYAAIPSLLKSGPAQVDIWGVVAAYTPGTSYLVSWYYGGGNDQLTRSSAAVLIPGEDSVVGAQYLGTLDVPEGGLSELALDVEGTTVGTSIDFDYIVFVIQKPTTFVMQPFVYAASNVFGSGNTMRGVWDSAQIAFPDPLIAVERTTGSPRTAALALGDAWVGAQGNTLAGIWMASELGTAFRYANTAGGTTPLSVTFSAQRRRAYPLPE